MGASRYLSWLAEFSLVYKGGRYQGRKTPLWSSIVLHHDLGRFICEDPSATLRVMDYLWTPWRYTYLTTAAKTQGNPESCIFCELPKLSDMDAKIVHRRQHCYIILNSFPYTSGHVMVVPFLHLDELGKLPTEVAQEMIALSQKLEGVLRQVYSPDGINLGMNIGRAAGAGVAGHVHMHVLPRWIGDASFITVVGESRVLPETLDITYKRIRAAM